MTGKALNCFSASQVLYHILCYIVLQCYPNCIEELLFFEHESPLSSFERDFEWHK